MNTCTGGLKTALAVGEEELVVLAAHFAGKSQWMEAAKSRWAAYIVCRRPSVAMMDEVMELLEKCGPTDERGTAAGTRRHWLDEMPVSTYRYSGECGEGTGRGSNR
jgi:hypothetical protein